MTLFSLPPALLALVVAFSFVDAQYPPPANFSHVLVSPVDANVTVSYKQPKAGTCTTAFSTQKQYSGYIDLPPSTLAPIQQNYSINTFFWFIEARTSPETAPLTIWLNGGPGTSSMFGLFNEVGPCQVVQMDDGTYGTTMREYGWDRASNMLFIDQPNQVGFSYDVATNASFSLYTDQIFEPPTSPDSQLPSWMYLNGTFGSANSDSSTPYANTSNTTQIAAAATWYFLQTWLSTFTQYNPATRPNDTVTSANNTAGVNLFTESYGGKYAPVFAAYFEDKNQAIANGTLSSSTTLPIQLQSVGIMNGLIDDLIQDYYFPYFAYNNTYGIKMINLVEEDNAATNYTSKCEPAIQACRAAGSDIYGDNATDNSLCESAQIICNSLTLLGEFTQYDPYDIRQTQPSPDPSAAYQEYLNDASVLQSIGAAINYTESSTFVQQGFVSTGDTIRGGLVEDLASLIRMGIRVALIYGDADYLCNWYGGQAVSLAIASSLSNYPASPPSSVAASSSTTSTQPSVSTSTSTSNSSYAYTFPAAGYADIVTNSTYVGGAVRQYGNLSFSRVYNSGHFVPYFQPDTAFQIFARVILGNDISTGEPVNLTTFSSNGPQNSTFTASAPPAPAPTCWVRSWNASCSEDDTSAMLNGQGSVQNGIYFQDGQSASLPTSSVTAGVPGSPVSAPATMKSSDPTASSGSTKTTPAGLTQLTGLYTATATPTPTKSGAAAVGRHPPSFMSLAGAAVAVICAATLLIGT